MPGPSPRPGHLAALVVLVALAVHAAKVHERMTEAELRRVFQVERPNDVPAYEVVEVAVRRKRAVNGGPHVALAAFGRRISLELAENSDFNRRAANMKVLEATSADGRLNYAEAAPDDVGAAYHDAANQAAVLLAHDARGVQLHGTIGNDLVIRPLPRDDHDDDHDDDELFLDEDEAEEEKLRNREKQRKRNAHVVFRRPPAAGNHSDFAALERRGNWTLRRRKRQAPDTVWPEVLLVVDYDSFVLHGGTSRDVKRYFISFWNGVDLRYKLLAHPAIRVSLAGMIVAKDRDATPYLERNRLRAPNADAVDAAGALTDMGKYLYREDRLPTYDLAVVITKLDMCRRRYEGGRCNRGTAGFAYVGGACVVNKRLEKVNSVAIIEDSGGFSGIIVAAHEVGHLLGCVHDGSPPPSYLGGPGATRCPWEDGFIMSDLRHTERGFRWSSCSVEQFKHFLNGETATCLYNFPHENQLLPRVLPGTMLSLDEQCKRDRGTNACFKDSRVCAQLFCFDSASGYCVSYRPAAEGSPCGDGHVCRNGRCLQDLDNVIPDYTHVTQVVSPPEARADTTAPPRHPKAKCRDAISRMAGALSCGQFLERFGDRYCNHNYIKRNCCAAHAQLCVK